MTCFEVCTTTHIRVNNCRFGFPVLLNCSFGGELPTLESIGFLLQRPTYDLYRRNFPAFHR
jgi:hypothetical protein